MILYVYVYVWCGPILVWFIIIAHQQRKKKLHHSEVKWLIASNKEKHISHTHTNLLRAYDENENERVEHEQCSGVAVISYFVYIFIHSHSLAYPFARAA